MQSPNRESIDENADSSLDATVELNALSNNSGPTNPAVSSALSDAPQVRIGKDSIQLTQQTNELVRSRLRAASLILGVMLALSLGRSLLLSEASGVVFRLANLLVVAGCCGLLFSTWRLGPRLMQAVELLVFGTVGLQVIVMTSSQLILFSEKGDVASATAMSVLSFLIWSLIILIYGIFMPNTWQRAMLVLFPASLVPHVTLMILARQYPAVDNVLQLNRANVQVIMPFIAMLTAVYAAHLIHSVRQGAFKAQRFGQYHLKQLLGTGAMGEVYEAEHLLLKRPCAIKLIRPAMVASPAVLKRFEQEVKATAGLSHWNTVQVFDYGQSSDGVFYYVMELLPGLNLAELVQRFGALPAARVLHLLHQACDALSEAHENGLIHRDVKPANVFVARRGGIDDVVKLLDFGLVYQANVDQGEPANMAIAGTPHFMSPEQASGKKLTSHSDLYSLGATAYFMLTGQPPFPNRPLSEIFAAHKSMQVTRPSELVPHVPTDVEQIVMQCLEKNPLDRFESAAALAKALGTCTCARTWTNDDARDWWRRQTRISHPIARPAGF